MECVLWLGASLHGIDQKANHDIGFSKTDEQWKFLNSNNTRFIFTYQQLLKYVFTVLICWYGSWCSNSVDMFPFM